MNAEKNEDVAKEQSDPVSVLQDVVFDLYNLQSVIVVLKSATSGQDVDLLLGDVAGVICIVFERILDSTNNLEKVIDILTK